MAAASRTGPVSPRRLCFWTRALIKVYHTCLSASSEPVCHGSVADLLWNSGVWNGIRVEVDLGWIIVYDTAVVPRAHQRRSVFRNTSDASG